MTWSKSPNQYAQHRAAQGLPPVAKVVDISGIRKRPTIPAPPEFDASPASCEELADDLRAQASRLLTRANDLDRCAGKRRGLEGRELELRLAQRERGERP